MITVIGNGESRKTIDIDKIKGIKVGCNAIYLYNSVDYICAMDKFWRDKIVKETKTPLISRLHNNSFQTTLELYDGKWNNTDCVYRGYCSGITALDYMANTFNDDIYMIGFDFNYKGEKVNHIYKGQKFHPSANRQAQCETLFLRQFIETYKRYPKHNIIWVSDEELQSSFLIKIKRVSIEEYKNTAYKED